MNHFNMAVSCLTPFLVAVGVSALKPIWKNGLLRLR